MSRHSHTVSLPLSQIISSDAPLLSPLDSDEASWDQPPPHSPSNIESFSYNYYNFPASPPTSVGSSSADSPIPACKMLKRRMSPDSSSENEQLCIPTHQVFDFPAQSDALSISRPSSPTSQRRPRLSISINSDAASTKRSASPAASTSKKSRACGERISTKDFVPPDVSGLSKREARLVKNRAAAFLSRQRKREEFETMEVRVAELEHENARLLALSQNGNNLAGPSNPPHDQLVSEIAQLRAQLAASEKRAHELCAQLQRSNALGNAPINVEPAEAELSPSPSSGRSTPMSSPHKSGTSFGLMVLLCALPTLLSMPTSHLSLPVSGLSALSAPSSSLDLNSIIPKDYDWSRSFGSGSMMDLDDHNNVAADLSSGTSSRKLGFVDSAALEALRGMDISFDASQSENGRIRVRIHPSPAASTRSSSPEHDDPPMWSSSGSDITFGESLTPSSTFGAAAGRDDDPFLGVGNSNIEYGLGAPFESDAASLDSGLMSIFDESREMSKLQTSETSEFGTRASDGVRRRVRIALKSLPAAGGEGGEWEVQIC